MTNRKHYTDKPTADWTTADFQAYLKARHEELYGISYVARNYGYEGRNLKAMIAEHGAEVTRAFIDGCFAEYRPTAQYPGLNFGFMFTWQKERVLPRVLAEQAKQKARAERKQAAEGGGTTPDLTNWW